MNLQLKMLSAFLLSITLIFLTDSSFAQVKKRSKPEIALTLKSIKRQSKKPTGYTKASTYMMKRKVASVKKRSKKVKTSHTKAKRKKEKIHRP